LTRRSLLAAAGLTGVAAASGTGLDGAGSTTNGSTTVPWTPNNSTKNQWTSTTA
jgi:hypothetical protein